MADNLLEKNKKLFEEKNELRKKIDGISDRSIMEPSKVGDLEFKAKSLEETNLKLLKEIRQLKKESQDSLASSDVSDLKMKIVMLDEVKTLISNFRKTRNSKKWYRATARCTTSHLRGK